MAYAFDGSANSGIRYTKLPQVAGATRLIVSFWAWQQGLYRPWASVINHAGSGGTNGFSFGNYAAYESITDVHAYVRNTTDASQEQFGALAPLETWIHWLLVYNGAEANPNRLKIYKHGVLLEPAGLAGAQMSDAPDGVLNLGRWIDTGVEGWAGRLAEVGVWFGELSTGQMIADLAAGKAPSFYPNGLTVYLPLINTTTDSKGNVTVTANSGTSVIDHPAGITYPVDPPTMSPTNWTNVIGGFEVVNQQVKGSTPGNNYAYWNATTFGPDQYAEVRVINAGAGTFVSYGPVVRLDSVGNGYTLVMRFENGVARDIRLARIDAGTFVLLHTYGTTSSSTSALSSWISAYILPILMQTGSAPTGVSVPTHNSVYRLSVQGSVLRAYQDGVQFGPDITDTTHTSGQPGIRSFGTDGFLDDWAAGAIAAELAATRGRIAFAEMQVPIAGAMTTRGRISWASFDVPFLSQQYLTAPTLTFSINGIDRTTSVRKIQSIDISYRVGSRGVARLETLDRGTDTANAYRPQVDQVVVIADPQNVLFQGTILAVRDRPLGEPNIGVVTEIEAVDFSRVADSRIVNKTWTVPTSLFEMVHYLWSNFLQPAGIGFTWHANDEVLEGQSFEDITVTEALNRLSASSQNGVTWRVNPLKVLQVISPGMIGSPGISLASTNASIRGGVTWSKTRGKFVNRVVLKYGPEAAVEKREVYTSNGVGAHHYLTYALKTPPLSDTGLVEIVGSHFETLGPGAQWVYGSDATGNYIYRPAGPLPNGQQIAFTYTAQFPQVLAYPEALPTPPALPWEEAKKAPDITDKAAAIERAAGLLRKYSDMPRAIQVRTRAGFSLPGNTIHMMLTERTIPAATYLITDLNIRDEADGGVLYDMTLIEGTDAQRSWVDYFRAAFGGGSV